MTKRPPTPTGWSDTDWIKKLQYDEENPLACLHINQGSFDAAADAYEEEYKMSKRTAMDIALDLDAAACSSFVKLEAAEALRQQQAEVERLTKQNAAYRTLNSAQSKQLEFHRSKDAEYQEAIATIDSERAANEMLTAERDAAIANASALTQHLTRVIGDHCAPSDCFSSGPMFGDPRDAICPACEALRFLNNPRNQVAGMVSDRTKP